MATNTDILGLTKPAYNDDADVSVINANMDLIDAESGRLRGNFAGTYDATASYAVGAYCIYQGNLYRCTTAIGSGGEAWTAEHWTQVSAGEEITLLNGNFRIPTTTLTGDLNNALTPGWYEVDASCTNKPPVLAAGKLEITYSGTTNYVRQTYYCGYDSRIYTRTRYYSNNAWQWVAWQEITNTSLNSNIATIPSSTTCNTLDAVKTYLTSVVSTMADNDIKTIHILTGSSFSGGYFKSSIRYSGHIVRYASTQFSFELTSREADDVSGGLLASTWTFSSLSNQKENISRVTKNVPKNNGTATFAFSEYGWVYSGHAYIVTAIGSNSSWRYAGALFIDGSRTNIQQITASYLSATANETGITLTNTHPDYDMSVTVEISGSV